MENIIIKSNSSVVALSSYIDKLQELKHYMKVVEAITIKEILKIKI